MKENKRGRAQVPDEPITARATPPGEGAIAVIRCTGTGSVELAAEIFSKKRELSESPGYTLHHGKILDRPGGRPLDEVMVAVYRAPKSYTGQDGVEISCHGSPAGVSSLIAALEKAGFSQAEPGEFTLRAFLNGKIDLTRAEAVNEIVRTKTRRAHELAFRRLDGAVGRTVAELRSRLTALLSEVELTLDYPEEELPDSLVSEVRIEEVTASLLKLAGTFDTGVLYQHGARVALSGKTNVGKSSLFNLFLKEDRSIVTEVHGTTRDYIESWITIDGIPVRLFDTAGIRQPREAVEAEGIKRSERLLESAEIVIVIHDASCEVAKQADNEEAAGYKAAPEGGRTDGRFIHVWNKIDITSAPPPAGWIPLSAVSGEGFDVLETVLKDRLTQGGGAAADGPVIDSSRQRDLLLSAAESLKRFKAEYAAGVPADLLVVDLQESVRSLREITGEITSADVLDNMFKNFCLGK